jgi:hypothetical protein
MSAHPRGVLPVRPETVRAHRVRWFARTATARIPRTSQMRGGDWGWDATCSCGWETGTGGGVETYVAQKIAQHRWDAEWTADHQEGQP